MKNKLTRLSIVMLLLLLAFATFVVVINPFKFGGSSSFVIPFVSGTNFHSLPTPKFISGNSANSTSQSPMIHHHHHDDDGGSSGNGTSVTPPSPTYYFDQ